VRLVLALETREVVPLILELSSTVPYYLRLLFVRLVLALETREVVPLILELSTVPYYLRLIFYYYDVKLRLNCRIVMK
jgi:hypothetical protein